MINSMLMVSHGKCRPHCRLHFWDVLSIAVWFFEAISSKAVRPNPSPAPGEKNATSRRQTQSDGRQPQL